MKKLTLMILGLIVGAGVSAQKLVPKIKANSIINYTFMHEGQSLPMVLTFNSLGSPTKMDWAIDGVGSGSYEMSAKALESGKGTSSEIPEADVVTKLPDYKTVVCISKTAFADLIKTQTFEYDDLKYAVQPDAEDFKLNDKALDVIHVKALNGKGEMWILNNPDFPLICKTKNSAAGTDLSLVSIQ